MTPARATHPTVASPLVGGEPRRNRNPSPTHPPAYTLVELVVVIGIISLLMAVTIPSVSWMWEGTRLADAENSRIVRELSDHVQDVLQRNIDEMVRRRKHVFWGRVFEPSASNP